MWRLTYSLAQATAQVSEQSEQSDQLAAAHLKAVTRLFASRKPSVQVFS